MIQFVDPGGEYYFSLGPTSLVWSTTAGITLVSNAPAGRLTTYAITAGSIISNQFTRFLGASFVTLWAGMAIYIPAAWLTSSGTQLISLLDSGSNQVDVRSNAAGNLIITRNGTVLGTSANTITNGSGWHYIEFRGTINGSTGSAEVWVDNVQWLSVTGVNTQTSGNASANQVKFYGNSGSQPAAFFKDIYILDTASGANTTRLGDSQVVVIFPNSAGPSQSWTNNGGASQTASVQDGIGHTGTWPDGDTTYISDSVSGHISDFVPQTLTAGTIYGIVHVSYVRSDAGATNFQQYTKSSATVHTTANISVNASYNYYFDVEETDPNTSTAWTATTFNNATYGVKIP